LIHYSLFLGSLFPLEAAERQLPKLAGGKIGLIEIGDKSNEISDATWIYVRAALKYYSQNKPDLLIIQLNTPGGEVFAAERIADALKNFEKESGVPVLAYINNWAVSAGAMLTFSCPIIAASKDAIMGAAMPITVGAEGMQAAPEKVNSALRTDFASRAQFFGRSPAIAEAMVDPDTIVVRRNGQIIKLASMDEVKKGSDEVISAKGKLLTLTAHEMKEYGIADFLVEPGSQEIAQVALKDHPLVVLPWAEVSPKEEIIPFKMDWQTRFVAFLASPAVSSVLVMVFMVSMYMEISSGGFGLAALAGLTSLFFLGLVSNSQEAISWLEGLLLLFGSLLIFIEVVYVPTFGFLAVIGGLFCLAGVFGIILPGVSSVRFEGTSLNAAGDYVLLRLVWLMAAMLLSFLIILLLARPMKKRLEMLSWLVLKKEPQPSLQFNPEEETIKLGAEGTVVSTLRPSGKVEIEGKLFDAVSTGQFVDKGKKVKVIEVVLGKLVVEQIA